MNFMFFFSIKYSYSDILLKKKTHKLHLSRLLCCNHKCYCVNMVLVTSASRYMTSASHYHPCYQSRSSKYIHSLFPRNFADLDEAVPIGVDSYPVGLEIYFLVEAFLMCWRGEGFCCLISSKISRAGLCLCHRLEPTKRKVFCV